jgi:hypothetical protein
MNYVIFQTGDYTYKQTAAELQAAFDGGHPRMAAAIDVDSAPTETLQAATAEDLTWEAKPQPQPQPVTWQAKLQPRQEPVAW